jgi:hypothetical protein
LKRKKNRIIPALLIMTLFISGCALFPRRAKPVMWPEDVRYLRAFGEVDMNWKDLRYSGTLSLRVDYPDLFFLEVYGPFGETELFLKKDPVGFLVVSGSERVVDQQAFERRLGIKLDTFVDDLTLKAIKRDGGSSYSVAREGYSVVYDLSDKESRICWRGSDGSICVRILEAGFQKEGDLGKGSTGGL